MRPLLLFSFVLFYSTPLAAALTDGQVRYHQTKDDQIVVTYNLGQKTNQTFTVELWLSPDGGQNFTIQPRSLSGDVGEGITGGSDKRIVWDVFADIRKLEGDNFVFQVIAIPNQSVSGQEITVQLPGGVTMKMVWIEPGTFMMGSPSDESDRDDDEKQHRVTLSKGFYLGKYEITQAQWEAVMKKQPWSGKDFVKSNGNHPAVYISWEDVQEFTKRVNRSEGTQVYRLPTEAEWEYACRAGTTTRWSFGDHERQLKDYAWYRNNAWDIDEKYAHAVGTKLPNPWGLYDMHGNVWEWTMDWYSKSYYNSSPGRDPSGPTMGSGRVVRGGSFSNYFALNTRSANRNYYGPSYRNNSLGARLLRTQ